MNDVEDRNALPRRMPDDVRSPGGPVPGSGRATGTGVGARAGLRAGAEAVDAAKPSGDVGPGITSTLDTVLARLDRTAERGAAGAPDDGPACVAARRAHGIKSVVIDQPLLGIVRSGSKRVIGESLDLSLSAGELFVVRGGRFDVVNRPDREGGLYRTLVTTLCNEVLEAARLLLGPAGSAPPAAEPSQVVWARMPAEDVLRELDDWGRALAGGQAVAARLALAALLLRVCDRAHPALLLPVAPSLNARIRELVAADPARNWRSVDIEQRLGLSGATLRRRLASQQTSLRDLITEARLARGLDLLYTTGLPVKVVAARVGYQSAPSFARRFQERFGLAPSAIGAAGPVMGRSPTGA